MEKWEGLDRRVEIERGIRGRAIERGQKWGKERVVGGVGVELGKRRKRGVGGGGMGRER